VSDLEEIAAGSNPLSSGSAKHVTIAGWSIDGGGHMVITWNYYANQAGVPVRFLVESCPNLTASPVTWTQVGIYTTSGTANGPRSVTDTLTAGPYYRLRFLIP
jgi:hypothetical protein